MNYVLARPDLVAAAILTSGTFTIPESTRATMRGMTVMDLAHSWFGPPRDSAEPYPELFTSSHRALGADHWQVVMADFLAGFDRPDAEDYPRAGRTLTDTGADVRSSRGSRRLLSGRDPG